MDILIKNGRVIDPKNELDAQMDLLLQDGKITRVEKQIEQDADKIIDAKGLWVTPGFIDLHVHLREPGFEYKEDIKSGTQSAVMGGFTTVCCMPNTRPTIDNSVVTEYIYMKAQKEGYCRVLPIGAITKGQEGKSLSDIGKMAKSGICAVSEDGYTVENSSLMKTAMKYAVMFDLPIFSHCEDAVLARGSMNAGDTANRLGLKGITNESEDIIVARDIILAQGEDANIHICHISTKGAVNIVKFAKEKGIKVTAEVTPHHFTLVDEDITEYDGNYKMNPPLRSIQDRATIIEGLKDDIIEVIATDHAPHHMDEKNGEFETSLNGIVGLETALPLSITELVERNVLTPFKMIEKLTKNPARILKREDIGHIGVGAIADITIIDPDMQYEINVNNFKSKGKNSPFNGKKVKGKVLYTIFDGEIVVENGELIYREQDL